MAAWDLHHYRSDLSTFQPFSDAAEPQRRCMYATFHGEYALTVPVTMLRVIKSRTHVASGHTTEWVGGHGWQRQDINVGDLVSDRSHPSSMPRYGGVLSISG